jgi:hypothetical protein
MSEKAEKLIEFSSALLPFTANIGYDYKIILWSFPEILE